MNVWFLARSIRYCAVIHQIIKLIYNISDGMVVYLPLCSSSLKKINKTLDEINIKILTYIMNYKPVFLQPITSVNNLYSSMALDLGFNNSKRKLYS